MLHIKRIKQMEKSKMKPTLRKRAMLVALGRSMSIVSSACRMIQMNRLTHYRWMKQHSRYQQAGKDLGDESLDFVESKLINSIGNGSVRATIFYLKTKGKKRGYVEKTELEQDLSLKVKDF
jgi:hypothetical protein